MMASCSLKFIPFLLPVLLEYTKYGHIKTLVNMSCVRGVTKNGDVVVLSIGEKE
jgi:hypothetical protein